MWQQHILANQALDAIYGVQWGQQLTRRAFLTLCGCVTICRAVKLPKETAETKSLEVPAETTPSTS